MEESRKTSEQLTSLISTLNKVTYYLQQLEHQFQQSKDVHKALHHSCDSVTQVSQLIHYESALKIFPLDPARISLLEILVEGLDADIKLYLKNISEAPINLEVNLAQQIKPRAAPA